MSIYVVLGDITELDVDMIVNAANKELAGGGGVDGAIHAAAGPELAVEATKYAPLPTGRAVTTEAYALPSKWVVHTVGPIWGVDSNPYGLLSDSYENCYRQAVEYGAKSIAFPAIGTGAYGVPAYEAAMIACTAARRAINAWETIEDIHLVCYDQEMLDIYTQVIEELDQAEEAAKTLRS